MKIFINRTEKRNQSWGGGGLFTNALFDFIPGSGYQITNTLDSSVDVIFIQDPRPCSDLGIGINEILAFKKIHSNVKIIQRVNECSARKGEDGNTIGSMDSLLRATSHHTDLTIFVSNWMKSYHSRWYCPNQKVIINGVNKKWFKLGEKINNRKINIVSAHWSDNKKKGEKTYQWLDDFVEYNPDFTFTYIGRSKANFKYSNHIQPLFGESLGAELGKYDLCINASEDDPGPNSVIESISCGLPTYVSSKGGGGREFSGDDHIFSDFEDLKKILKSKEYRINSFVPYSWKKMVEKYVEAIEEICQ